MPNADFIYSSQSENRDSLQSAVSNHFNEIKYLEGLDRGRLLMAIAGVETSFNENNIPRYEVAYDHSGLYGRTSSVLIEELKKFGALAACSYGPWQILYISAKELGFMGHPIELWLSSSSIHYVIEYFNRQIDLGAKTLADLSDSWNSGSFRDVNRPQNYIDQVQKIYENLAVFE